MKSLLLVFAMASAACAQIQTEDMFGFDLQGTQDALALGEKITEGEAIRRDMALVFFKRQQDRVESRKQIPAGPAFVVHGKGLHALINMRNEFRIGEERIVFLAGGELSIVFYTEAIIQRQVQLLDAERSGNKFVIPYQFVDKSEASSSSFHYAVMPIGRLEVGDYEIVIEERSGERKDLQHLVCSGAKFIVSDSANYRNKQLENMTESQRARLENWREIRERKRPQKKPLYPKKKGDQA